MERKLIEWLQERGISHPWLVCGIGDDASVHRLPHGQPVVVTTDMIGDGVHFRSEETSAAQIGRKALAVNLSDLAAMAARPVAAWAALLLPRDQAGQVARELLAGMLPLAAQFDVALAGGDTNVWDGALAVCVTAMGVTEHGPLLRSQGRPGDWILVTGQLGGSLFGRHLDFVPRVAEALWLRAHYRLRAGMDISDGLALDLSRMADASGCGAVIEVDRIPLAPAAHQAAARSGHTALQHALEDGEDFELLLAVPPDEGERIVQQQPLDVPISRVGELIAGTGLWQQDGRGLRRPLAPVGYEHGGRTAGPSAGPP